MISFVRGNLFESPAHALVNTVNTVGAMGKGLALQFKRIYPEMFKEYQLICESGRLRIGVLFLYRTKHKLIVNFPTKEHWRRPSKLEYIEAGLRTFVQIYEEAGIHSAAFPPLGCGNGELSYDDVLPVMLRYLEPLPIPIYLYPPLEKAALPEHKSPEIISAWLHEEPRSMPFSEVWADMQSTITAHSALKTPIKHTPFTVEFDRLEDKEILRVRAAGKTELFSRQEVAQIWRALSSHGIATTASFDSRAASFLFPVFARLPYVSIVQVANTFDKFNFSRSLALQVVAAPRRDPQHALAVNG